nr:MAG TPA: hypothetical protein [Caudoviricetes sp.]
MWPPELHTTERAGASQRPRRSFCAILQREAGKTGAFAPLHPPRLSPVK